jgi:hypothetical protein
VTEVTQHVKITFILRLVMYQVVELSKGLIGPDFLVVVPTKWALIGLYLA